MDQEVTVTVTSKGSGGARADIVIWASESRKDQRDNATIVVECKSDDITIQPVDYFQGLNYASRTGAKYIITHNRKETRCYLIDQDSLFRGKRKELSRIPSASDLVNPEKLYELKSVEKRFDRSEFSRLLKECHNKLRTNDNLTDDLAFDEISKVLFIKIQFEKDGRSFSLEEFDKLKEAFKQVEGKYHQKLFKQAIKNYKSEELFRDTDLLNVREETFEFMVKNLEKYNLTKTSDDIKGVAFEQYLSKTFRGTLGQFFTPRPVVDYMVESLDPKEGELICDPCCGSGGFLIKSFEFIRDKIEKDIEVMKMDIVHNKRINDEEKKVKINDLNQELVDRLHKLSNEYIFGVDADARMARVSKMNMIMQGDGHGGVHHFDGLLDINGIFEERFDLIITNPPFGAENIDVNKKIEHEDSLKDNSRYEEWIELYGTTYKEIVEQREYDIRNGTKIKDKYKIAQFSLSTEILFMERCLNLLKKGGRLGLVIPDGVLTNNNKNSLKIRTYFESKAKISLITSIPQDVFKSSNTGVKTSLLFLKKFTEKEEKQWTEINRKAEIEVSDRYNSKIQAIQNGLKKQHENYKFLSVGDKKGLKNKLNKLKLERDLTKMELIKTAFNYTYYVSKVDHAGIDAQGRQIKNELPELKQSYLSVHKPGYNKPNNLWEQSFKDMKFWGGIAEIPISITQTDSMETYHLSEILEDVTGFRRTTLLPNTEYRLIELSKDGKGISSRERGNKGIISDINQTQYDELYEIRKDDIIYGINIHQGSIGLVDSRFDGYYVSKEYPIINLRPGVPIDLYYLTMLFTSKEFYSGYSYLVTGSSRLSVNDFLDRKVPFPTLDIQRELSIEYKQSIILKERINQLNAVATPKFRAAIFD